MVKKLLLISILIAIVTLFSPNRSAYAHFIVEDGYTGVKASFHITPDHDPIAGKKSIISFDFAKTGIQAKNYSYSLAVKSARDEAVAVPLKVVSNVIIATYIFPTQGFYDIKLIATNKNDGVISEIRYGQRVSRGVIIEDNKGFGLLEISIVIGVILVSVGAIIVSLVSDSNKRRRNK